MINDINMKTKSIYNKILYSIKYTIKYLKNHPKEIITYVLGLMVLSTSIALIQNTNLGMAPWDALARNFYEGVPIAYTYLSPIMSIILISLAYLIRWKKPDLFMIVPVLISTIIGIFIDVALLFVPNVEALSFIWNYFYLFFAMVLISIGLNVIIYCGYTLPALEQFILALSYRLNITFGRAKLLGEAIAFSMAILSGLIFKHQSELFFMGQTTIIVLLFIGLFVDLMKKPTRSVLIKIL